MGATIYLDELKVESNARVITGICRSAGIRVVGVTKAVCGDPRVANAMLRGGVSGFADSRLSNLARLRRAGFRVPLFLLRSPALTEISDVVRWADGSLNSELQTVRALSRAAKKAGRVHRVLLMLDSGERREGVAPCDVLETAREILALKCVALEGLGVNFSCMSGLPPTREQLIEFVSCATRVSSSLGFPLAVVSGGNSSSLPWVIQGQLPRGINQLRVGETILLGNEVPSGRPIPALYRDAFVLNAEVIEVKLRPDDRCTGSGCAAPMTACPRPCRRSALVNIGSQDVEVERVRPTDGRLRVVGASSDHIVLDVTGAPEYEVGSRISFIPDYHGLVRAMTSPYIEKLHTGTHIRPAPSQGEQEGMSQ